MARDVDIVLVDATCPFGNGNVIPAGSMREPKSAFSRADILVITKANQADPEQLAYTRAELEKLLTRRRYLRLRSGWNRGWRSGEEKNGSFRG